MSYRTGYHRLHDLPQQSYIIFQMRHLKPMFLACTPWKCSKEAKAGITRFKNVMEIDRCFARYEIEYGKSRFGLQ